MRRSADSIWLIGGLLLLWQAVALTAGPDALASPWRTIVKLGQMFTTTVFLGHISETGEAFLIALAIAIVAGLAIGLLIGLHDLSARIAEPFLLAANSVPKIALYPIVLPASLPEIFTGIRIGVSLTLIGTILGEMFGSQRGLGFLLMTAIGLQNTEVSMAVTLLLVVFAATVSTALIALDRRLRRGG